MRKVVSNVHAIYMYCMGMHGAIGLPGNDEMLGFCCRLLKFFLGQEKGGIVFSRIERGTRKLYMYMPAWFDQPEMPASLRQVGFRAPPSIVAPAIEYVFRLIPSDLIRT